ncbi:hypothetical protein CIG19_09895 [Enterobacterales bacterium CwR94]|nr:hypothetical protein CIG19_09895 [Enterobacterales bacterium CwR94]
MKKQPLNRLNAHVRQALALGSALFFALPATAASTNPAVQALLDQANYWHQKAHDDLARQSLEKVLMVESNNPDALYLMSLWAQQRGDQVTASQWRNRLAQTSPQDARLSDLENARAQQAIPATQLALARQQARSGNISASLQTWRNLFPNGQPPESVAAEYYLTMAGDRTLLPQAVDQLRQLSASRPQDNSARLALGKALTYQEATRREGLQVLSEMADGNKEANSALRQGLLWLGPKPEDAALYQNWQQRHPQDNEVLAHYRKNVGGAEKGAGFTALNSGDTATAQTRFDAVLQANPQDADALAGLGYVAQRKGDFATAADYLDRAAKLGGDNSTQRQQQADDARFYGQLAQAQAAQKAGDNAQALSLSESLANASGEKGVAAKLFRADVQRRSQQLEAAEQSYRGVLQAEPDNRSAKEGLFYVLRQQNRGAEANTLLASLPDSVKAAVAPRGSSVDPIRRQAKQALTAGNSAQAISLLQSGIQRYPNEGWLRLDLARILLQQGDRQQAATVMQPTMRSGASRDEVMAGALFASEAGAWQQAQSLLSRIHAGSRTADQRELAARVNFNLQMAVAQQYLSQGSTAAAANTLKALAVNPPSAPADVGNLAKALAAAGDTNTAVSLVRGSMQQGVKGNAGDYAAQVAVLNQAGLGSEAQQFLSSPELQARSTPTQLAGIRNGYVVNEADRLREQGQYAAAYDKLIQAMQSDPTNSDLMFAMARLYQSGKMNKEAGVVYDYLITRDTPTQDARAGAVDVALAQNDVAKAKTLSAGFTGEQTPDRLLLLARVAEADGDRDQALSYLRTARGKMIGLEGVAPGQAPIVGGLALNDNPFINRTTLSQRRTPSTYGNVMPWQQGKVGSTAADLSYAGNVDPSAMAENRTLRQIDSMMDNLQDESGTWVQGEMSVRSRDGEDGLSKLTEAKAPLTWSSAPFGDTRFNFTVTPITLSAGSANADGARRFGAGELAQGVSSLVSTINGEIDDFNADPDNTTTLPHIGFDDLSPFNADGYNALMAINSSTAVKEALAASTHKPNASESLVSSPGSQQASGAELNLALTGNNFKIDLGSTPLGQDLTTLVGGISWSPKLTDYLTLILTGERRPVTDSLLSYVGARESYSGIKWGQVTKNGGSAQLSYDNGDAGFYVGGGAYAYRGTNVADNESINANAGIYVRPFRYDDRQLQVGVGTSWMDFSKNLSYYTYGHGGYFSPQNYVSVSVPVEYTQKYDDLAVRLGGSVGYQSYSQDRSAYFPTDPEAQAMLEEFVKYGFAKNAYYEGGSKNGIGYNLHAGADYKVNKNVTVGGQLGYDTFGDYNESTAKLYFRYLLGDK